MFQSLFRCISRYGLGKHRRLVVRGDPGRNARFGRFATNIAKYACNKLVVEMFDRWVRSQEVVYLEGKLILVEMAWRQEYVSIIAFARFDWRWVDRRSHPVQRDQ